MARIGDAMAGPIFLPLGAQLGWALGRLIGLPREPSRYRPMRRVRNNIGVEVYEYWVIHRDSLATIHEARHMHRTWLGWRRVNLLDFERRA